MMVFCLPTRNVSIASITYLRRLLRKQAHRLMPSEPNQGQEFSGHTLGANIRDLPNFDNCHSSTYYLIARQSLSSLDHKRVIFFLFVSSEI